MIHAKKSLGQNFLNSKAVAHDIVHAAQLTATDTVLEIGPGKGFLTAELLASGAHVVAIEKDGRMMPILEEKFSREIKRGQLSLIEGDIVEMLLPNQKFFSKILGGQEFKLVANIPYYITGFLLRAFLEAKHKPALMVLMVQKEVAVRIVARDKKESILSIAVKAYGVPHLVKKVPARYFTPAPKVDSAILLVDTISNKNFADTTDEKNFFEILKAGFAHKRKMLSGNLKPVFGKKTAALLKSAGIKENSRAEDVSLEQWLAVTAPARTQQ